MRLAFGLNISPSFLENSVRGIIKYNESTKKDGRVFKAPYMDDIFNLADPKSDITPVEFDKNTVDFKSDFVEKGFPIEDKKDYSYKSAKEAKVLGMHINEKFEIHMKPIERVKLTDKRSMVSQLGKFFDPLSLFGAIQMAGKKIQRQCKAKGWDDELDEDTVRNLNIWLEEVDRVARDVRIPRLIVQGIFIVLVDASKLGYGVVVLDQNATICCGKNAIWNECQGKWTTPKQELYSLVMGEDLISVSELKGNTIYLTDSEINQQRVVNESWDAKEVGLKQNAWLQKLVKLKINVIHISGKWNLADPISRGLFYSECNKYRFEIIEFVKKYLKGEVKLEQAPWKTRVEEKVDVKIEEVIEDEINEIRESKRFKFSENQLELDENFEIMYKQLCEDQAVHSELKDLLKKSKQFYSKDELIYLKGRTMDKLFVSVDSVYVVSLIRKYHLESMHGGIANTVNRLSRKFHLVNMTRLVELYCKGCVTCNLLVNKPREADLPADEKLNSANKTWQICGLDLVGPLISESVPKYYVLTLTDRFSRFTLLQVMKVISTVKVINIVRGWFNQFGCPKILVS